MRRLRFVLLTALIAGGAFVTRHLHHDQARELIRRLWEGHPAPSLEGVSLPAFRGHPVLLFFWAHWCPDCKADVRAIAAVKQMFSPRGLVLFGPTQLYGYVAGGEAATPEVEKQYI
jgi:thiol-disulfide isomerase/thioredoxin